MNWKEMFTSSVGKKLVMGFTGIFLLGFLLIHVGLNACIWANDHGEMFNRAAHFMGAMVVINVLEIGLFAGILAHIVQGIMLTFQNRRKRVQGYAINFNNQGSKWYSRSMGLLGTLILIFLIIHLSNFWLPSRFGGSAGIEPLETAVLSGDHKMVHNLYAKMLTEFQNPYLVLLYVGACVSLAYHLLHGFQSAFRSLGVYNSRYLSLLNVIGKGYSILVSVGFAMMPISIYFGWVK